MSFFSILDPPRDELAALAAKLPDNLYFGTSSWNYPGWYGIVYEKQYPLKAPAAKMLAEYARWPLARTVGIDSFFYRPASAATLRNYAAALPPGFRCVSKVWNRITAHSFTGPESPGPIGHPNPDWLHPELYLNEVLGPMREHFSAHLGPQVFELQTISRIANLPAAAFAARLDRFFSALPTDVPYAVEIRNTEYLSPEYFAVLREHGVAHVFNSWTRMPPIGEQLLAHESLTANFIVMRALNKPGRTFQEGVEMFEPFDRIQDENPQLRADIVALARSAVQLRIPAYLLVGNRAEGNSPLTIAGVARILTATE